MTGRFRGPGRRGLRDEVQATWSVYDAARPIRSEDFTEAAAPQPSPLASPSVEAEKHGATTLAEVTRVADATDAELANLFGISEMEVRESRKWAREQAERLDGATVTDADPEVQH